MNVTESPEYLLYSRPRQISGQIAIIVAIILLALLGNLLMISAVMKMPYLRTVTNLFTINLAVTDIGVAVIILPTWIVSLSEGSHLDHPPFPEWLCFATAYTTVLLLLVSISTLAGISLDRYLCICHPLRYPIEVTPKRMYCVVVYIWIQSFLLASAPLLGWGEYKFRPQTIPICNPEWRHNVSFAIFLVLVGLALPFGIMLFSYIRIVQEARKQVKRIEQIQLQIVGKDSQQITVTETSVISRRNSSLTNPKDINKHEVRSGPPGTVSDQVCADTQTASTASTVENASSGQSGSNINLAPSRETSLESRRPSLLDRMRRGITFPQKDEHPTKTYSAITRNLKTLKTVFIVVGKYFPSP